MVSSRALRLPRLERLDDFKDLPTVAETLPGFVAGGWNVLLAPVGTPDAIIQKTSVDLRKALDDAEVKKRLAPLGAYTQSDDDLIRSPIRHGPAAHLEAHDTVAEKVAKVMTGCIAIEAGVPASGRRGPLRQSLAPTR